MTLFYFITASLKWNVPLNLLLAMCMHESRMNPNLLFMDGKSPSIGICSVKLAAAHDINPGLIEADLKFPEINIHVAAAYLRKKYDRYKDWDLALAAYNAGRVKIVNNKLINSDYIVKVKREMKLKRWDKFLNHIKPRRNTRVYMPKFPVAIMGVRG